MKRLLSAILIITMLLSTVALAVPQAVTIGDSVEEEFLGPEDSYGELSGDNYTNLDYFKSVTLTGDMATDIANVAYAQVGKTYYDLGYDEIGATYWCARFVSDCARIAGVPLNVIGKTAGASAASFGLTKNQIIDKSNAKNGDLVFWVCNHSDCSDAPNWHVGIYYNGKVVSGSNGSNPSNVRYYSDSSYTHGNSAHNSYIEAVYYRPNYTSNATKRIEELKELFPSGSYFSVDGKACNHTSKETCSNCNLVNVLKRDDLKDYRFSDGGSWTCLGFAKFAWYFIHGKVWSESYDVIINKGTPNKDFFNQAVPGDMVYFFDSSDSFRHAAIFVSASDTSAEVYHANTGGVPNKVSCGSWSYSSMSSNYGSGSYARLLRIKGYVPDDDIWSPNTLPLTVNGSHALINAISTGGEMAYYEFTPTQSGKYTIYSTDTTDTQVYLYDEDGNELAFDDDSGEGQNFSLTYDLTAGTKYIYGIKFYDSTETGDLRFTFGHVYNVNYNANGGSGAPNSQSKLYGTDLILSSTVPTRDGYTFEGWATNSSGSVQYDAGDIYSSNSSVTLYAVWGKNSYNVFCYAEDDNGASRLFNAFNGKYGEYVTIPDKIPTRTGYTFLGWSNSEGDTSPEYVIGDSYLVLDASPLYAVWQTKKYTILYHPNGGTNIPENQTKLHGIPLATSELSPTREGFSFNAWYNYDRKTYLTPGSEYDRDAHIELYPIWVAGGENDFEIEFTSDETHENYHQWSGYESDKNVAREIDEEEKALVVTAKEVTGAPDPAIEFRYLHFKAEDYPVIIVNAKMEIDSMDNNLMQMFFTSANQEVTEAKSVKVRFNPANEDGYRDFVFDMTENEAWSNNITRLRLDPFNACEGKCSIKSIRFVAKVPVTDVALDKTSATMDAGDTLNLTATVNPADATNKNVTWTSSDTSVATVENGVVTAKSAGTATITATTVDGGKTATCTVTVTSEPFDETEYVATGYCGDNIIWVLDNEGTLTISGTGKMWDGEYGYHSWNDYRSQIFKVVVEDGVTYIGGQAFGWCENLSDVQLPETVTGLGYDAFYSCSSLIEIKLPSKLKTIGQGAFGWCEALVTIDIPDSVTSIGKEAFYICNSLVSVSVPDGVTNIGNSTFEGCHNIRKIKIGSGVTSIGDYAFKDCFKLKNVTIPDGVVSIRIAAFEYCESLEVITIPESVISIEEAAFNGCENLTIYGYADSEAESYANENGISFELVGSEENVHVTGVTLNKTATTLKIGDEETLTATVAPEKATNKNVIWTSSDESVATVKNGVVTVIGPGSAIITVTTEDGGFTDECCVEVWKQYTIYYNANSGSGAPADQTKTHDIDIVLSSKTPRRAGYIFKGWATERYSDIVEYYAGENYADNTDLYLYAVWERVVSATKVTLNKTKASMAIGGDDLYLEATMTPVDSTDTLTWSVDKPEIATVDENGVVTAHAAGKVKVTAVAGSGKKATCSITVGEPATKVEFSSLKSTSLAVGKTLTLKAKASRDDKVKPVSTNVVYEIISGEEYATIDAKGKLKGVATGEVVVRARAEAGTEDAYADVTINVCIPATKVKLNMTKATMIVGGEDLYLTAELSPEDNTDTLTWSVDKPEIAEVDENGVVTAYAAGKVKVTATTGSGKKATCTVTVGEPATKVEFTSLKATSLAVGKTLSLKAKASRDDKVKPVSTNVVYEIIEGEEYATIDAKGKLKGVATGEVVVRAWAEAGTEDAYADVTINVCIPATKVKLNMTKATVSLGDELQLEADITPVDNTDTLTWISANEDIATVDEDGLVTVHEEGKVKITAVTGSGKKATCTVTVTE